MCGPVNCIPSAEFTGTPSLHDWLYLKLMSSNKIKQSIQYVICTFTIYYLWFVFLYYDIWYFSDTNEIPKSWDDKSKDTEICVMCEFVMKTIESKLNDNKTEVSIPTFYHFWIANYVYITMLQVFDIIKFHCSSCI